MMSGVCMLKMIRLVILGWEIEVREVTEKREFSRHRVIISELWMRWCFLKRYWYVRCVFNIAWSG